MQDHSETLYALQKVLLEIHGHLGTTLRQRVPSDDALLMANVAAADNLAQAAIDHTQAALISLRAAKTIAEYEVTP